MKKGPVILGVALLVVILALAALVVSRGWSTNSAVFFALLNAPAEVKEMIFVTEPGGASGVSRVRFGGVMTKHFPGMTLLDAVRSGDTLVALLEEDVTGYVDVFDISGDGMEQITRDGAVKSSLALSPDGSLVAFSVRGEPFEGVPEDVYDVRRFETVVMDTFGNGTRTFEGNHPHFLDKERLLTFSSSGITVNNLRTGGTSTLSDRIVFRTIQKPSYGSNGFFVIENPVVAQFDVFRLTSFSPVLYEFVGAIPAENGYRTAMRGTDIFVLSVENEGIAITKYPTATLSPEPLLFVSGDYFVPTGIVTVNL